MKTLLLIAGRSRRFWPLRDKCFFPVCGKTLLEHQIERLRGAGIAERDIILVGGAHNLAQAKKLFPKIARIEQKDLDLGMQGALLSALPKIGSGSVMIVSSNDVIASSGYHAVLKAALVNGSDGAILARKVSSYFPGGYLTIKRGNVTGITEKPGAGNEPSDFVNIVAHAHGNAAELLRELKNVSNKRDDGYERALGSLLTTKTYKAVPYDGPWHPVKYPWHLLPLLDFILSAQKKSIHRSVEIHRSAVVEGPVVIEEGVRVLSHATIKGPVFIGRKSVIGTGALVRGASIGQNCIVGFQTEVKSSLLAGDVWTHMTYIGDSVIGENVSFGGGATTGNFRLDEREIFSTVGEESIGTGLMKFGAVIGPDCRIGIQVGINPGVKVGSGSFIAGGSYVSEDIPEGRYVVMKDGRMEVRENRSGVPGSKEREKLRKKISPQ